MDKHTTIEMNQEQMIALISKKKNIDLFRLGELAKTFKKSKKLDNIVTNIFTKQTFRITLPFPPSINRYYGKSWRGNVYIKPDGKIFREKARIILENCGLSSVKTKERLKAVMVFHPPDKRNRDWDNIQKATWDCLKKQVYEDDGQLDFVFVGRGEPDYHRPRVDLVIETSAPRFTTIEQAEKIIEMM